MKRGRAAFASVAGALLLGACAASPDSVLPAPVGFEAGTPGEPPGPGSVEAGYRLSAEPMEGISITEVAPVGGNQSLCIGGAGFERRVLIEATETRGDLANDRPLGLALSFRMTGFGRAGFDWRISGQSFRQWQMIVARALHETAEPEPVGGFFSPDAEQPLFLFENGGRYRLEVSVDPVEREPYRGLRQAQVVVTDIGDPGEETVVYDSYGFFEVTSPLPDAYTGQSLEIVTEQSDPGAWPCLDSALTVDDIVFIREE